MSLELGGELGHDRGPAIFDGALSADITTRRSAGIVEHRDDARDVRAQPLLERQVRGRLAAASRRGTIASRRTLNSALSRLSRSGK